MSVYIVQAEISLLIGSLKRDLGKIGPRYYDEDSEPLILGLSQLKDILNNIGDLSELDPVVFLLPFLEVIRSEETSGPSTGVALHSIDKFLTYGFVDRHSDGAAPAVEGIADAVTHGRFVGTDPASDEVVLMKILGVLRSLLFVPVGCLLSDEAVCEMMQSCFRICLETRLSELLRRTAEHTLLSMIQLLFSRLPQLQASPPQDTQKGTPPAGSGSLAAGGVQHNAPVITKLETTNASANVPTDNTSSGGEIRSEAVNDSAAGVVISATGGHETKDVSTDDLNVNNENEEAQNKSNFVAEETTSRIDESQLITDTVQADVPNDEKENSQLDHLQQNNNGSQVDNGMYESENQPSDDKIDSENTLTSDPAQKCDASSLEQTDSVHKSTTDFENNFTTKSSTDVLQAEGDKADSPSSIVPIHEDDGVKSIEAIEASTGEHLPAEKEVLPRRESISPDPNTTGTIGRPLSVRPPYGLTCVREVLRFLVSLLKPDSNSLGMIQMALNLITSALETGGSHISLHESLVILVQNEMARYIIQLMNTDRLQVFAATLRVAFLMFESMRHKLKFQLEMFLQRLFSIISSDSDRVSFEQRETALEAIASLWRLSGFVTELYLNYDTDPYRISLFEELVKVLSKNAFPVGGRLLTTHVLSLEALLAVVDGIERRCNTRVQIRRGATGGKQQSPPRGLGHRTDEPPSMKSDVRSMVSSGGYTAGFMQMWSTLTSSKSDESDEVQQSAIPDRFSPIRPTRRDSPVPFQIPTEEEIAAAKYQKKILISGSEKFNQNAKDGIIYLQNHGLLATPADPQQIAHFLRDNPRLDMRAIGDYISSKKNKHILEAFVQSFDFAGQSIEESLRHYLETFRLPGEAPLIQHLLEHFADQWHVSNNQPMANEDAVFTLSYAIMMLNTDQHNPNSRRQNVPMTEACFKKNLKGMNGGGQFDPDTLSHIYWAIHNDEIVMPSEQTGAVKENYLWKVLMRRATSHQSAFLRAPVGVFDRDIFSVIWGPTVAALSYVLDKTVEPTVQQKAIADFRKCAMISAHYGLTDVFDNLIISLCKFTTLLNHNETSGRLAVSLGRNEKARVAAKTMFHLSLRHSDILREGWKSLVDCLLPLYKARLLPESLLVVEDFVNPDRHITLLARVEEPRENRKSEQGMFSSFYLYLTSDSTSHGGPTAEEETARQRAAECIKECRIDQLIEDSRFLQDNSLTELVKALIFSAKGDGDYGGSSNEEEGRVLYQELLLRVLLQNRDRVGSLWPFIRTYLYWALIGAAQNNFLLERAVVGLFRLSIRLLRRNDMALQVFQCLRLLLLMKPSHLATVSRHTVFGLHDLLRSYATTSVPSPLDWRLLLALLETCGVGVLPDPSLTADLAATLPSADFMLHTSNTTPTQSPQHRRVNALDTGLSSDSACDLGGVCSDSEHVCSDDHYSHPSTGPSDVRGYTSDTEIYATGSHQGHTPHQTKLASWHIVESASAEEVSGASPEHQSHRHISPDFHPAPPPTTNPIVLIRDWLPKRDIASMSRACATLVFLVRDPVIITRDNCSSCIQALRVFVEACLHGGSRQPRRSRRTSTSSGSGGQMKRGRHSGTTKSSSSRQQYQGGKRSTRHNRHTAHSFNDDSESEDEEAELNEEKCTETIAIQMMDLLLSLHSRVASLYLISPDNSQEENMAAASACWTQCWRPLLQALARLCSDSRRSIRGPAITCLQRALLAPELHHLDAVHWQDCFSKVLFPMLSCLLDNLNPVDPCGVEETRMRASALLCKLFLQRLPLLIQGLPDAFLPLWLTIIHFMDKYMHASTNSDLLAEAIPESLKNMLLVMHTSGILTPPHGIAPSPSQAVHLWNLTWSRIGSFIPTLQTELFPPPTPPAPPSPPPKVQLSPPPRTPIVLPTPPMPVPSPNLATIPSTQTESPIFTTQPQTLSSLMPSVLPDASAAIPQSQVNISSNEKVSTQQPTSTTLQPKNAVEHL